MILSTRTVFLYALVVGISTAIQRVELENRELEAFNETDSSNAEGGATEPVFSSKSDKSCAELGWQDHMVGPVCAASYMKLLKAKCAPGMNYKQASKYCQGMGARLCTSTEMGSDVAKGTGCSLDKKNCWTSTPCDKGNEKGHYVKMGSTLGGEAPTTQNCMSDTTEFGVRCCADASNQVPASENSAAPAATIDLPGVDLPESPDRVTETVPKKPLLDCPDGYELLRVHGFKTNFTDVKSEDIKECGSYCSKSKTCNLFEYAELDATTDPQAGSCILYDGPSGDAKSAPARGATACYRLQTRSSCIDLGFKQESLDGETICEFSCNGPECPSSGSDVQYTIAEDYCMNLGTRLCSIDEVLDNFRQQAVSIWTYKECAIGHHMTVTNRGNECNPDNSHSKIRCCADLYGRLTAEDYKHTLIPNATKESNDEENVEDLSTEYDNTTVITKMDTTGLTGLDLEISKGRAGLVRILIHPNGQVTTPQCMIVDAATINSTDAAGSVSCLCDSPGGKNDNNAYTCDDGTKGSCPKGQVCYMADHFPKTGSSDAAGCADPKSLGGKHHSEKPSLAIESSDKASNETSTGNAHHSKSKAFGQTLVGKKAPPVPKHKHKPHSHTPHKHSPHRHSPPKTRRPTAYPTPMPTKPPTFSNNRRKTSLVQHHQSSNSKAQLVGEINIHAEYEVVFDIHVIKPVGGWSNIVHFTSGGNCCKPEDRSPAIFLYPGSTRMHVVVSLDKSNNFHCDPTKMLPIGKYTNVRVQVHKVNGGTNVATYWDNKLMRSCWNPGKFPTGQRKVYMGDPWYKGFNGVLANFKYYNYIATKKPTLSPTPYPTKYPTGYPTKYPTGYPTKYPTGFPTHKPTKEPTPRPTPIPTGFPTEYPSPKPTSSPTKNPTAFPTVSPTREPTKNPTIHPTEAPTTAPTDGPTVAPTTCAPTTKGPTFFPTTSPTIPPTPMEAYLTTGSCVLDNHNSVWSSDRDTGLIMKGIGSDFMCLSIANEFQKKGGPVGMMHCDANNPIQKWVLPDADDDFGLIKSAFNTSLCLTMDMPVFGAQNAMGSLTLDLCDKNLTNFEVASAASNPELAEVKHLSTEQLANEMHARGMNPGSSNRSVLETQVQKALYREGKARGVEDEDLAANATLAEITANNTKPLVQDPEAMTLEQLQDALDKRGLPTYGTKSALADRLSDALEDESGKMNRLSVIGEKTAAGHVSFLEQGKCIGLRSDDDLYQLKAVCPHGMAISDLTLESCGNSIPGGVTSLSDKSAAQENSTIYGAAYGLGHETHHSTRRKKKIKNQKYDVPDGVMMPFTNFSSFLESEEASEWYPTEKLHNNGENCWLRCQQHGGKCVTNFCGRNGYCCRKGYNEPGCGMNRGCTDFHCCTPPLPPTNQPTPFPTEKPTYKKVPTSKPTYRPSRTPTKDPTVSPTSYPTSSPTIPRVPHFRYLYSCIAPVSTFGRCGYQDTACMDIIDAQNANISCPVASSLRRLHHKSKGCPDGKMKITYECCGTLFASVKASARYKADEKAVTNGVIGDVAGVTIDVKGLKQRKDCKEISSKCAKSVSPLLDRKMTCPSADWLLVKYGIERDGCPIGSSALRWTCCELANAGVSMNAVSVNRIMITVPASTETSTTLTVPGALGAASPQGFSVKVTHSSQLEISRVIPPYRKSGKFEQDAALGWDTPVKVAVNVGHTYFPFPGVKMPSQVGVKPHSIGFARQYCTAVGDKCQAITPVEGGYVPAVPDSEAQPAPVGNNGVVLKIQGKAEGRYAVTPSGGAGHAMCLHTNTSLHAQVLCCNDKGIPTTYQGCRNVGSPTKTTVPYFTAEATCSSAGLSVCSENSARSKYARKALKRCEAKFKGIKVWTNTACQPRTMAGHGQRGKLCSGILMTSIHPLCILECRHRPRCKAVMWKPSELGGKCELASVCNKQGKDVEGPMEVGESSDAIPILRLAGGSNDDGEELLDDSYRTLHITETGPFGKVMNDLAEMPARFNFIDDGTQTTAELVDFLAFISDSNELVFGGNSRIASVMHRLTLTDKLTNLMGATPGVKSSIKLPIRVEASGNYHIVITKEGDEGILFAICDGKVSPPSSTGLECKERAQLWSIMLGNTPGTKAGRSLTQTPYDSDQKPVPGNTYFVLGRKSVAFMNTVAPTEAAGTVPDQFDIDYRKLSGGKGGANKGEEKKNVMDIINNLVSHAPTAAKGDQDRYGNGTLPPGVAARVKDRLDNSSSNPSPAQMPTLNPAAAGNGNGSSSVKNGLGNGLGNGLFNGSGLGNDTDFLKNRFNGSDILKDLLSNINKNHTKPNATCITDKKTGITVCSNGTIFTQYPTMSPTAAPQAASNSSDTGNGTCEAPCEDTNCSNPTPDECGCMVCPVDVTKLVNQTVSAVVQAILNNLPTGAPTTFEPTQMPTINLDDDDDCKDDENSENCKKKGRSPDSVGFDRSKRTPSGLRTKGKKVVYSNCAETPEGCGRMEMEDDSEMHAVKVIRPVAPCIEPPCVEAVPRCLEPPCVEAHVAAPCLEPPCGTVVEAHVAAPCLEPPCGTVAAVIEPSPVGEVVPVVPGGVVVQH